MAKIPLSLVVYNHLMACAWGVIGRLAPTDVGLRCSRVVGQKRPSYQSALMTGRDLLGVIDGRWLDNEIGGPELSHGSEQVSSCFDSRSESWG
eukprot:3039457-Amphidinium_carterae.1